MVRYQNGRFMCYALCTYKINDVHSSGNQMVGLSGIQIAFKYHLASDLFLTIQIPIQFGIQIPTVQSYETLQHAAWANRVCESIETKMVKMTEKKKKKMAEISD